MTTLTYLSRRAWAALDDVPGNHWLNFAFLAVALAAFTAVLAVSLAAASLVGAALGGAGVAICVAAGVDRARIVRQAQLEARHQKALTAR